MRDKVFVAGAGGFIGGHLVEALHLARAYGVRAGVRRWSSCARIGRFPVDIVRADLLRAPDLEQGLEGITHVVHCAQGSREETRRGTRNLLAAALRNRVRRFVYISSAVVYGNATGRIDETWPIAYTGDEYTDGKIDAERVCAEFSAKGLPVVILRPAIVYGPYSWSWTVDLSRRLMAGQWGTFPDGASGKCNLVFVGDLVRAIIASLDSAKGSGEAFNVNGPDVITWNDYFLRIKNGLGLAELTPSHSVSVRFRTALMEPIRMVGQYVRRHHTGAVREVAAQSAAANRMMRRLERSIRVTPSRSELDLYRRDAVYVPEKARSVFGFVPRVGVDEGLRMTNEWVLDQGEFA